MLDEWHTPLDSMSEFRLKMRRLGELVERRVQMIYLTATLPPHAEPEFMKIMKIRVEDVHMFRAATSRPNIEYEEDEFGREDIVAVCKLVEENLKEYPAPAKNHYLQQGAFVEARHRRRIVLRKQFLSIHE